MNVFEIASLIIWGSVAVFMAGVLAIGVYCEFIAPLVEDLTAKRKARKL